MRHSGAIDRVPCLSLVPATLAARILPALPKRLVADRGYDSDALDATLPTQDSIEMVAHFGRTGAGRRTAASRRTKRRWKIERLFSGSTNSRRLVTRWEYHVDNFLGMLQLV